MSVPEGPIGLVGLGLVGTALGARLAEAGFEVIGHDQKADVCTAWQRAGHRLAGSLDDLAGCCHTVMLAVFDTAGVIQIAEGPGGLSRHAGVTTVLDCSTGDPEALQALAARLAARGACFIEAPLSGSSAQIAAGEATMLLGGEAEVIDRHAALLGAITSKRVHVGGPGMAARAKLATNLVLGLNRAALAEGMVFAERQGIAPETFLQLVLTTPARSEAAVQKGARMVQGDFAPQSRVRQHLKDVQLMLEAARVRGQQLPLTEAHAALLRAAVDAGDGDLDNAAIIRQLRRAWAAGGSDTREP